VKPVSKNKTRQRAREKINLAQRTCIHVRFWSVAVWRGDQQNEWTWIKNIWKWNDITKENVD
jgi:hypothetical protein